MFSDGLQRMDTQELANREKVALTSTVQTLGDV